MLGMAALLTLTFGLVLVGCDNGGGEEEEDSAPSVSGAALYTFNGSEFAAYPGSSAAQSVKGKFAADEEDFGVIGSISADGKLTLSLPPTVPDSKLEEFPLSDDPALKMGQLSTTPYLFLMNESSDGLFLMYFNKAGSAMNITWKKGWNYASIANGISIVTDISGYKWVIQAE